MSVRNQKILGKILRKNLGITREDVHDTKIVKIIVLFLLILAG